jgi:hypothetical protein
LLVKVPVLSEQITVTDPSASTAGNRRTIARRRDIRCTPIARVTVMIAGSPSGIADAARATAIMNISETLWPRHSTPMAYVNALRTRMTIASTRPNRLIWRNSGVAVGEMPVRRSLMSPISVWTPVPTTTPVAWPCTTRVPE